MKKIFISYSSGDQCHNDWVGDLADTLEHEKDFHIILDQYDLDVFKDKNKYMEDAVTKSDVIVVIATIDYKNKADNRTNGVGIESQLTSHRHYKETEETNSSNIIVVLRETGATPNYLTAKIHIDFTNETIYSHSLQKLIQSIKGTANRKRPKKLIDSNNSPFYEMTRIEDILKIIYHKRRVIINNKQGTDYASNKRIKYELWEVKVPKIEYILILYKNINIGDTVKVFSEVIIDNSILLDSLTVIRVDNKTTSQLESDIKKYFPNVALSQLTLKNFISELCIDSELSSGLSVWEEPYFIDQLIYKDGVSESNDQAIPFMLELINSSSTSSAQIILAEGGDGKSSLCSSLVNTINRPQSKIEKSAILLRIDEIREKISTDIANNFQIKSVYDIYNLFSQLFDNCDENKNYPKISSNDFEVRVFCGNLVVIIDGLDELYSVFQDRFDKVSFLESIQSLNNQLGESSIILTSRGNIFAESSQSIDSLEIHYLKGFNYNECDQYFKKRFRKEENSKRLRKKCSTNVQKLMTATKVDRISPFVVDLISASIGDHQLDSDSHSDDNDYSLIGKHYPSNNEFKDKVVFHILRREKSRQEVHITIKEMISLFCEISSEYGSAISLQKLKEICDIYYEKQATSVYNYLTINPLLSVDNNNDIISFRYHFLHDYFLTLYIINGLKGISVTDHFTNAIAKYAEGSSAGYLDILKYFKNSKEPDYSFFINKYKSLLVGKVDKQIQRSISFLIHLIIDVQGQGISQSELSKTTLVFFIDAKNSRLIKNLYIYGNTSPLDLSGYTIEYSGFYGYSSFLTCNLDHTFFSYSTIDIDLKNLNGVNITRETFDSTCRIGKLGKYILDDEDNEISTQSSNEEILRRFLRNFIKSNTYIETETNNIVFPKDHLSASSPFFREAVSQHILYLSKDNTKCGVTKVGEKCVQDYLTNNVLGSKLYKVLQRLNS